jgi:hypothetical protein
MTRRGNGATSTVSPHRRLDKAGRKTSPLRESERGERIPRRRGRLAPATPRQEHAPRLSVRRGAPSGTNSALERIAPRIGVGRRLSRIDRKWTMYRDVESAGHAWRQVGSVLAPCDPARAPGPLEPDATQLGYMTSGRLSPQARARNRTSVLSDEEQTAEHPSTPRRAAGILDVERGATGRAFPRAFDAAVACAYDRTSSDPSYRE